MTDARECVGGPARQPGAKKINVRVFANEVDGEVVFTHDWAASNGQPKDPPVKLQRGIKDWDLSYRLFDFTGRGLQFVKNADDAMWVRKGGGCPQGKGSGGGHVTFRAVSSTQPGGPRDYLTVSDDNEGAACTLHYMLRFEDGSGTYKYDPEIKNGGTN